MRIIIIGASGLLGMKAFNMFSKEHKVYGTYQNKKISGLIPLDISNYKETQDTIEKIKPELVLNTAAITNVDLCDENPKLAWDVNVTGCFNLATICEKNNIKLISISTDYVFSGKDGPYQEDSKPSPLGFYGMSKFIGEKVIRLINPMSIVVRVPILYGYNGKEDKETVVTGVLNKLKKSEKIEISDYRIKYPLLIDDAVINLISLYKKRKKGIFHFSTQSEITRYDLAIMVAEIFDLDKTLIYKCASKTFKNRPKNVKLLNTKENFKFTELREGIQLIKKQMREN
jgi:dTDP-4-dehydrorhamnose reductase